MSEQINFTPLIERSFKGQYIKVNQHVSIGKMIEERKLLFTITVRGETLYLRPQTVEKCITSLHSLLHNNEMDQELDRKIKTKIISMSDYLESHPYINSINSHCYCACEEEAKP